MSSKGFYLNNPRGNNRDLQISVVKSDGTRKKLRTVRPGQAVHFSRSEIVITEVERPLRLLARGDGTFVEDRVR